MQQQGGSRDDLQERNCASRNCLTDAAPTPHLIPLAQSGSKEGNEVAEMIRNGVIVPAEITVGLLQKAMAESGKSKILIDGFPRNASNRDTFLKMVSCAEAVRGGGSARGRVSGRAGQRHTSVPQQTKNTFLRMANCADC